MTSKPKYPLDPALVKAIKGDMVKAAKHPPKGAKLRDVADVPDVSCRWVELAPEWDRLYRLGYAWTQIRALVAVHIPDITTVSIKSAVYRWRRNQQAARVSQRRAA